MVVGGHAEHDVDAQKARGEHGEADREQARLTPHLRIDVRWMDVEEFHAHPKTVVKC